MDKNTLISIAIPSRNNLKYLKFAYNSIRKNVKEKHEIILLDDASTDGTWEWMNEIKKIDKDVIIYKNEGPERVGHVFLYDKAAEICSNEIFSIFHADMIATPNYIDNALKYLSRGTVVCSTRIEPELHPSGPEKVTKSFGLEPEEFDMSGFLQFSSQKEMEFANKTTEGFFAPWFLYREDFLSIGGHDKKLFCPMELDDSDLANRFQLNGYKLIQSRDSFVYHMTCRGSRFKGKLEIERIIDLPDGSKWHKPKDSEEYTKLRNIKFREWWRKWHSDVLHDQLLKPIVYPRYDVKFHLKGKNVPINIISFLEPWCDSMSFDYAPPTELYDYIKKEDTKFNLEEKFKGNPCDITVEFDWRGFTNSHVEFIKNLPLMISEVGETGIYELEIFKITINKIEDYSKVLIKNEDFYKWKNVH
jgi:glycosyltransferase involved in cell wall biosynthesis